VFLFLFAYPRCSIHRRLCFMRTFICRTNNNNMIRSYLKIAWRNLMRNRVISVINIGGLALGLACAIILYLYAGSEFGYDAYYKNAERIYRVYIYISLNGVQSYGAKTSPPVAEAFRTRFPEVEANTLVSYEAAYNMRYGEKTFREYRVYVADSNYFKVFDHPLVWGNAATALQGPNQVVITQSTAKRYFGEGTDPIGRQITVNDTTSYIITGVMTDYPYNSHFNADMLLSMATLHGRDDDNWLVLGYSNFVKLKEGANAQALEQKLKAIVQKGSGPQIEKLLGIQFQQFGRAGNAFEMRLQPLTDIYLYSKTRYNIDPNTEWGHARTGNIVYVRIFIATALFVLLIAVFNFMNIATARSEKRAREVGIRKTLGSRRWQLVQQFLTEAMVTSFAAVVAAVVIVQLALPWFNHTMGKDISIPLLSSAYTIPALLLFVIIVGLLAGSYPAAFLSAYQPVETLKGVQRKHKATLRSTLVVSQFAISIALIIGMMVVRSQLKYMQQKDLGLQPQRLVTITNGASLGNKLEAFRQQLLKNPAIESVTNSSLMFAAGVPESAYTYEGNTEPVHASYLDVDNWFAPTFGLRLKEGRFFDPAMLTDSMAVVINETAARAFAPNASSLISKRIIMLSNDSTPRLFTIVGVVKDFNFESLHQTVKPLILHLSRVQQAATYITIKFKSGTPQSMRASVEPVWNSMQAYEKCNFNMLSDTLKGLYNNERRISALSTLLSVLAIFVACMGLFGLAMFITEQRTKEIGIRKVLGASVAEVVTTISKKFAIWIGIANLLAWPAAYIVLSNWLQHFAYRVQPAWWMFAAAGIVTMVVAMVTVGALSVKAAIANPGTSLRSE